MSQSNGPSLSGRSAAALAAALTLVSVPAVAQAQDERAAPAPPPVPGLYVTSGATRYSTPGGAVRFVFDRTGRVALLQFEGDPEVHVLRAAQAAGGGIIYSTENRNIMLRVTPQGAITLYTRNLQTGAAASADGEADRLTPEAIAFAEMQARFRALQEQSRQRVGQTITFSVPANLPPQAAGVVLDAAERAAEGLALAPMTSVRRVIITIGRTPAVALRGDQLFIQVAPQYGYAGRPSSMTIRNIVTGAVQGPEQ